MVLKATHIKIWHRRAKGEVGMCKKTPNPRGILAYNIPLSWQLIHSPENPSRLLRVRIRWAQWLTPVIPAL